MSEVTHLEQMQTADNQLINRLESLQRLVNNSDYRTSKKSFGVKPRAQFI